VSNRLTITAAAASAAASTGLFPLIHGGSWFGAGLGAIIVVAVIGTATRARAVRALPAAVCLLAALGGLLLYLNLVYAAKSSFGHVLPTAASLTELWRLTVQGVQDTQKWAAPVPPLPGIMLIATAGIGLVAALTDLIAVRLRQAALAGLPLLVLFSIPVATGAGKDALTDAVVFCLGVAGYLALLSADSQERLRLWGRLVTPWNPGRNEPGREPVSGPSTRALAASGRRIGVAAVALALVTPLVIPTLHAHKLFPSTSHGSGPGSGPGAGQAFDPLIVMNRQLQESRPTVVLTYQTADQSPGYLQVAVYRNLTDSGGWSMSPVRQVRLGGAGALPAVPGLTTGTWRAVHTTIQIRPNALTGDSFLPVPYPARQLDHPGGWLADPGTLALSNSSRSVSGLDYSVSSLDGPSPTQWYAAPAGPGPMRAYLNVPAAYRSLAPLARRITGKAASPAAEAVALQSWFLEPGRFKYSLSPALPPGTAWAKYFLQTSRTGYCQQFASAMAILARLVGIPSRVVVGYTAGISVGAGKWVVKSSDAHMWPELYFRGLGWLRLEPTPGGTGIGQGTAVAPSYAQTTSSGGGSATGSGSNPSGVRPNAGGRIIDNGAALGRHGGFGTGGASGTAPAAGGGNGLGVALIVLAALLAAALVTPRATRSLIRRRRWLRARGDAGRAHAAWLELLDDLTDYGIGHRPGETPRAAAKRVTAQLRLTGSAREGLLRITEAEERASYAREPRPAGQLRGDLITVRGAIRAAVPGPARWRGRLMPVSAADRARSWLSHAFDVFGWLEVVSARVRHRLAGRHTAEQG
jgi:transglutaminase-like putative cysteine protease